MSAPPANYDESKVPDYTLPDPLQMEDGQLVEDVTVWESEQRPRLLQFFETQVYGKAPKRPDPIQAEIVSDRDDALDGLAIRKEIAITLIGGTTPHYMNILLYLPKNTTQPANVFLGLNFGGNHTVTTEIDVKLPRGWISNSDQFHVTENRATEQGRGTAVGRWSIRRIIERGYGLATVFHADISTDLRDGFENSIHPYFYRSGQTEPAADEWGAISAWAWGLRTAMDYLELDEQIGEVMIMGHSRLGKAALWAGAQDQRFALVISNNSGCMGAALSRRKFGETIEILNTNWSRWVCKNFHPYSDREDELPIDQHTLLSLIAPRPVYIASAQEDLWADPLGEFLGGLHASPVYQLYGKTGMPSENQPPIHHPVLDTIGYHIRAGEHDVTDYDWQCYLDFADLHG